MKSLPSLTFATIAVVAVIYGLNVASLRGTQADPPQSASAKKGQTEPGQKTKSGSAKEQPSDAPGPESPEAKTTLDQARQKLLSYRSIKAKLTETVALGNRRFTVNGAYLQGSAPDLKLRLEFQVKVGDSEGSVLEVCDGQVLWTRHRVGTETHITKRDVRQILQVAAKSGLPENLITVELGFGGLPGLMASIEKSMQFDQFRAESFEGRRLVVLEGGWKSDMLKLWKGNRPNASLPDYVPSRVRLLLDAESLFPYRVLYLGRNAEQLFRPMVSLEFTNVETNVAVPADAFKFVPPEGVFPEDITEQFLKQIEQRQQSRVGGK